MHHFTLLWLNPSWHSFDHSTSLSRTFCSDTESGSERMHVHSLVSSANMRILFTVHWGSPLTNSRNKHDRSIWIMESDQVASNSVSVGTALQASLEKQRWLYLPEGPGQKTHTLRSIERVGGWERERESNLLWSMDLTRSLSVTLACAIDLMAMYHSHMLI